MILTAPESAWDRQRKVRMSTLESIALELFAERGLGRSNRGPMALPW